MKRDDLFGKYTYEIIKSIMQKEGYELLSTSYKNVDTKLTIKCNKGHIYDVAFKNFKAGRRCPQCRKVTFEDYVDKAIKNGYEVISEKDDFINARQPLKVKCKNGHISKKRYDNLTQGCKECVDEKKRNSFNYVKKYIEDEGFELLSNTYINNTTPLKLKCNNNHIFDITFSSFKSGYRCRQCSTDSLRMKYDVVKNIIEDRGYKLLSNKYIKNCEKLHMLCPNNHEFYMSFASFYNSNADCPFCNSLNKSSKGEIKVASILENNKINYIPQYKFLNCKDIRPLPFDFYLPNYNVCIEYDGEQHFRSKFNDDTSFYVTILHDAIKNSYCEDNNIKLIRIPYWDFNKIEEILTQNNILE